MDNQNTSLNFYDHSGIHTLHAQQFVPASLEEVWFFFSNPANLKKITPEHMGFEITSPILDEKMYPGQMISYRVSPLPGIRSSWLTEITQVREKEFFIDEQRMGPYRLWHHQHRFLEQEGGVMMEDIVTYQAPAFFIGRLMNRLLIRNKLKGIFEYRIQSVERIFGKAVGK